jgi:hypothetical protein
MRSFSHGEFNSHQLRLGAIDGKLVERGARHFSRKAMAISTFDNDDPPAG